MYFKIISLLSLNLFGENRLVKSFKLLPLSIKSINPTQKYLHITKLYLVNWVIKVFLVIEDLLMFLLPVSFLIFLGMCLTFHQDLLHMPYPLFY